MTEVTTAHPQPALSPREQRKLQRQLDRERKEAERARRRAEEEARWEAERQQALREAADRLLAASGKGAGLVAYRNLEATIKRLYPHAPANYFEDVLTAIGFDRAAIASPRLGFLSVPGKRGFEIFRDYVVHGEVAYDYDETTRAEVFTDGTFQWVQRVEYKKGVAHTVNEPFDTRTAHVQFTSTSWGMNAPIRVYDVPTARQLVSQVTAHVETLKPRQLSSADIQAMVDAILDNTGQPPAEKLRQLSNLRYERVISDKEFLKAKERILGID